MAHFYGAVSGKAKTKASRLGSKNSGLAVEACSWQGKVVVYLSECDGTDMATVSLEPHHGHGTCKMLYHGPVEGYSDMKNKVA
jgi:hypothetical protein